MAGTLLGVTSSRHSRVVFGYYDTSHANHTRDRVWTGGVHPWSREGKVQGEGDDGRHCGACPTTSPTGPTNPLPPPAKAMPSPPWYHWPCMTSLVAWLVRVCGLCLCDSSCGWISLKKSRFLYFSILTQVERPEESRDRNRSPGLLFRGGAQRIHC